MTSVSPVWVLTGTREHAERVSRAVTGLAAVLEDGVDIGASQGAGGSRRLGVLRHDISRAE